MRRMIGYLTVAVLLVLSAQLAWAGTDQKAEVFLQRGHRRSVESVAFSPDGRLALSGSDDKTLILWHVATGREIRRFEGHTHTVESVAFSPDGRLALSGGGQDFLGGDPTLRLWDVATGREIRRFEGHTHTVESVAFSPDGRLILSGSSDKTLRLWDVTKGEERRQFEGHESGVSSVAFSPDGRYALSGSGDKTLRLWDVATGKELRRFAGHTHLVTSVAFSPDGRLALSGSLSDLSLGDGDDPTLILWDVATGRNLKRFERHTAVVNSIAFSPDGRLTLSASRITYSKVGDVYGYNLQLWETATGKEIGGFAQGADGVSSVAFSLDGHYAISGMGILGSISTLWDVTTGKQLRRFEGPSDTVRSVAFSPDGRLVLLGTDDKSFGLWDVTTGKLLRRFEGHTWTVTSVAFSPDGRLALSGSKDGTTRIWAISSGRELRRFVRKDDWVLSVAFSPDGRSILSGSATIQLLDVSSGRELRRFEGHTAPVECVAFSPDGRSILSGSDDKTLRLWDVATGKELRRFAGHTHLVTSVAFSPDGRLILSGSWDKTLRLWDVATGKDLRRFEGHTWTVTSVAFSPNGRYALSGSVDGTMRLWSIATGREIASFVSYFGGEWIVVTPEGYYSASLAGHWGMNVRIENDVYGMDQFYEAFYRPDLVEKKLKGEDITGFTAGLNLTEALKNPPPQVTILSPKERDALRERTITVKVRIDDRGGGIGDIRLHHNGKLVESLGVYRLAKTETEAPRVLVAKADPGPYRTTRGTTLRTVMQERSKQAIQTAAFTPLTGMQERSYTITLTKGENTVSVSAFNGTNLVMSVPHSMTIKADIPERKPELFVLSIGNDHFANRSYNLTQAITDARDFTATVTKLASPHYAKVHTQILTDTTKSAILDAITAMTTRMNPEDTFILFSATHGRAEDDLYYLYTAEFNGDLTNPNHYLSSAELMELSKKLPALKQVVILDTCQAGALETIIAGLYDAKVSVLARALGMHIFSGTKSYQDALDNYKGNGLFTHFILNGLQGQADANQNREVSVLELNPYLTKTVKEASRGTQEPVVRHFGEDLPLTRSALRSTP